MQEETQMPAAGHFHFESEPEEEIKIDGGDARHGAVVESGGVRRSNVIPRQGEGNGGKKMSLYIEKWRSRSTLSLGMNYLVLPRDFHHQYHSFGMPLS